MPDLRPPRFAGDERQTLMALWRYHHESFLRKLDGVSDLDGARRLVGSDTTLIWLADHLAEAGHTWIVERFLGQPLDPPATAAASETVSGAAERCRRAFAEVTAIVDDHDLDELAATPVHGDAEPVNLRWIVAHLLEETARHAGHADILRELIDGSTGR